MTFLPCRANDWRTEHPTSDAFQLQGFYCKVSFMCRLTLLHIKFWLVQFCRSEQKKSVIFFSNKKNCAESILTNNLFLGNVRGISVKNSHFYMRSKDLLEKRTIMGFVIYTERPSFSLDFLASEFA